MQKASGYIKTTTTTNQERTTQMNELAITNGNGVSTHIRQATDVAGACRAIVKETCQRIGQKDYVRVEGWQAIAVAHGCVASARDVERVEDGYRCIGEVKRMDNGQVISSAEGFLGDDEPMWEKRPTYAKRAMCQTRAISRACRSAFAHIVVLIDKSLSTTPAEEVPYGGFQDINADKYEESPKPANSIRKADLADITAKLNGVTVKNNGNEPRDMELKFGKHKGSTLRQVAAFGDKGLDYLEWLMKQELKPGADGKPYKNDIIRNEIIQEILLEAEALAKGNPNDEIPF
ncbi:MAG: hypothetical protein EBS53_05470 [Bacteroidetes bacterium]|nr:hypothetical protein [Bacteroidota bacterium]